MGTRMPLWLVGVIEILVAAAACAELWFARELNRQGIALDERALALEREVKLRAYRERARSKSLTPRPPGMPSGSLLNDFELPDLRNGRVRLSGLRGERLAVLFVQP